MDMQSKAMIDGSNGDMYIVVGQHKDTGKYHGMLYVNHPTPSGSDRYMLVLSDTRGWDDEETAKAEFREALADSDIKDVKDG